MQRYNVCSHYIATQRWSPSRFIGNPQTARADDTEQVCESGNLVSLLFVTPLRLGTHLSATSSLRKKMEMRYCITASAPPGDVVAFVAQLRSGLPVVSSNCAMHGTTCMAHGENMGPSKRTCAQKCHTEHSLLGPHHSWAGVMHQRSSLMQGGDNA